MDFTGFLSPYEISGIEHFDSKLSTFCEDFYLFTGGLASLLIYSFWKTEVSCEKKNFRSTTEFNLI